LLLAVCTILLAGCPGDGDHHKQFGPGVGEVTGVVNDINNNPVRGANVYVDAGGRHQTQSSTNGTYLLSGVPEGDLVIKANVTQNGTGYFGQNFVPVFDRERS